MQTAAVLIADIGHARGQDRPAIDPRQLTGIAQFRQVAADRLQGHAEMAGQILDHHLAPIARELKDFTVPKVLCHMFCPYRLPVPS
jgi:hypothetical protein